MEKSVRFVFVALVIFAVFYAYFYIGYRPIIKQLKDTEEAINSLPSTDLMFIINGEIEFIKDEQLGRDNVTYNDLSINSINALISALGNNYRKVGNSFRYYDKEGGSYLYYAPKSSYRKLYHQRLSYPIKLRLESMGFGAIYYTWILPTGPFYRNDFTFDDDSPVLNAEYYLERNNTIPIPMTEPFFFSVGLTIYLLPFIALRYWRNPRNIKIVRCFYWAPVIILFFLVFTTHGGITWDVFTGLIVAVFVTLKTMKKQYTG